MDSEEERPSLSIHLKRTDKRPGSFVNGTVVPHMSRGKTLYVDKFTINLIGRIQLGNGKHSPSDTVDDTDTVVFLHLETPLDEHPIRLQDWFVSSFTFIIPEEPGMEEAKSRPGMSLYRVPEPKALPPSGDMGNGNIIDYSLKVAIRDPSSGDDISATLPLTFSRVRASEVPKVDEQPLVRRQTLRDRGRQISVKLAVDFPKSIVQEEPFPLTLRHSGEALNPAVKDPPTLRLASCCLQLLEQTSLCIPPNNESSYAKQHEIASQDVSASKDELLPVITEEGLDLSEILGHPAISCAFAPTFDCANIRRSYGMRALIQIQYDQISSVLEFTLDGVTLWPSETYSMARAAEEEQDNMDYVDFPDEGDWPC